jgi:hypothetical protein
VQAWAIGHALSIGLRIYQCVTLKILTPALSERARELLAALSTRGTTATPTCAGNASTARPPNENADVGP